MGEAKRQEKRAKCIYVSFKKYTHIPLLPALVYSYLSASTGFLLAAFQL